MKTIIRIYEQQLQQAQHTNTQLRAVNKQLKARIKELEGLEPDLLKADTSFQDFKNAMALEAMKSIGGDLIKMGNIHFVCDNVIQIAINVADRIHKPI